MSMRILTASGHAASGEVVGTLTKALKSRHHDVISIAFGPGAASFKKASTMDPDRIITDASPKACAAYLKEYRPEVIVTGTGHPDKENPFALEQSIVFVSKRDIPSVAVLDIAGMEAQRFSRVHPKTKRILEPNVFVPSVICAVNETSRAALMAAGIDDKIIEVTGNPHNSEMLMAYRFMCQRANLVRGWVAEIVRGGDRPIILLIAGKMKSMYAATGGYDEAGCVWKILGILKELSETMPLSVILRPHPAQKEANDEWKTAGGPNLTVYVDLPSKLSLQETIVASDLVIGTRSGGFVEARMADRQVVSFQPGAKEKRDKTICTAANEAELSESIKQALQGKLALEPVDIPADSTERVVSIVESFSTEAPIVKKLRQLHL